MTRNFVFSMFRQTGFYLTKYVKIVNTISSFIKLFPKALVRKTKISNIFKTFPFQTSSWRYPIVDIFSFCGINSDLQSVTLQNKKLYELPYHLEIFKRDGSITYRVKKICLSSAVLKKSILMIIFSISYFLNIY